MKEALLIIALSLMLAACDGGSVTDGTVTVEGEADLNLQENFTECQVRQNGNVLYVRKIDSPEDDIAISFDPAVLYPDEWLTLKEADALRVTPITPEEQVIIDGG